MNLYFSLFLAMYIIYILNYFKTIYSIAHPITYFNNKYMFHPIYNSKTEKSMICQFGHDTSWFLAFFIVVRCYLLYRKIISKELAKTVSIYVLLAVFMISLVNLNAVLYLIPYYILEIMYIKNLI